MKQKRNKHLKNQKGITLVALIITIIVLLILAVVTIQAMTGDSIITYATEAGKKQAQAKEQEALQLAVMNAKLEGMGTINFEWLDANLPEGFMKRGERYIGQTKTKYEIGEDGSVNINNSRLPKEYQEVEYIESTGTQYIKLGIYAQSGYTVNAKLMYTKIDNFHSHLGGAYNSKKRVYFLAYPTSYFEYAYINGCQSNVTPQKDTIYEISETLKVENQSLTINNETILTNNESSEILLGQELELFGFNSTNDSWGSEIPYMKLYNFSIALNDTLLRNMIPCKHRTTEEVGMYDTVEGKFYANANIAADAEDFKAGPEVY